MCRAQQTNSQVFFPSSDDTWIFNCRPNNYSQKSCTLFGKLDCPVVLRISKSDYGQVRSFSNDIDSIQGTVQPRNHAAKERTKIPTVILLVILVQHRNATTRCWLPWAEPKMRHSGRSFHKGAAGRLIVDSSGYLGKKGRDCTPRRLNKVPLLWYSQN